MPLAPLGSRFPPPFNLFWFNGLIFFSGLQAIAFGLSSKPEQFRIVHELDFCVEDGPGRVRLFNHVALWPNEVIPLNGYYAAPHRRLLSPDYFTASLGAG